MTRVAIVGLGAMGTLHARALAATPGVEVALAVDIDPTRRAAIEALGIPVGATLDSVLGEIDAVSVCLPDHLHVETSVKALKIDNLSPADAAYPYYQVFYYITKGEPAGAAKQFIDFTFSQAGRDLITKHGMIPID